MEENNYNRGAQSRLPLVGPGDQNLIRKETLAAGRFAPGLQAHSSMGKCSPPPFWLRLRRAVFIRTTKVGFLCFLRRKSSSRLFHQLVSRGGAGNQKRR